MPNTMTFAFTSARMPHHLSREEGGEAPERKREHKSVMTAEVLSALAVKDGEVVVDATYGRGGHSAALKKAAKIKLIALDADSAGGQVIEANFGDLKKVLGAQKVDKGLFDLGWNMTQLQSGRGFSFMRDEPLNMSYAASPRSGFTASEALNEWSEETLADVL